MWVYFVAGEGNGLFDWLFNSEDTFQICGDTFDR
jgi:hypothetical protein